MSNLANGGINAMVFSRLLTIGLAGAFAIPVVGATLYNNLTPNNSIAVATRPSASGGFEIEAGDDFVLGSQTFVNAVSFIGIVVPGTSGTPSISSVVAEMYRVFPLDSDAARTPNVPTRVNSPSDVAFATKDSSSGELNFAASILNANFTVLNSVQPGGIHPSPGQTTGGDGPLTGVEVQIDATFTSPFNLPADHFFFVPQVSVTNGGEFYWLSASRPVSGAGTTPFPPGVTDLQAWTRDANLDPDWLRVGADIVGGTTPPTFNTAFSLDGSVVPEPATIPAVLFGLGLMTIAARRTARRKKAL
jgi:hypothetical protein